MLNENVKKYADLKAQVESIKAEMEVLKEVIVSEMGAESSYTADDGTIVKLVDKETFKYVDEAAMVKYLKENGMSSYIVEKVNTTSMNKELKKGLSLTESMKLWYTKSVSTSLNVERQ